MGAHIFLNLFTISNGVMLLLVGDVPVDSEAHVETSSISRFVGPTHFFGGAHRDKMYMVAFIGVNVRLCL